LLTTPITSNGFVLYEKKPDNGMACGGIAGTHRFARREQRFALEAGLNV
jgi:hypothetical protein